MGISTRYFHRKDKDDTLWHPCYTTGFGDALAVSGDEEALVIQNFDRDDDAGARSSAGIVSYQEARQGMNDRRRSGEFYRAQERVSSKEVEKAGKRVEGGTPRQAQ